MGCKAQISVIRGDVKKEIVVVFGGVDHKIEDTSTYPPSVVVKLPLFLDRLIWKNNYSVSKLKIFPIFPPKIVECLYRKSA